MCYCTAPICGQASAGSSSKATSPRRWRRGRLFPRPSEPPSGRSGRGRSRSSCGLVRDTFECQDTSATPPRHSFRKCATSSAMRHSVWLRMHKSIIHRHGRDTSTDTCTDTRPLSRPRHIYTDTSTRRPAGPPPERLTWQSGIVADAAALTWRAPPPSHRHATRPVPDTSNRRLRRGGRRGSPAGTTAFASACRAAAAPSRGTTKSERARAAGTRSFKH